MGAGNCWRILLVEDNIHDVDLVRELLRRADVGASLAGEAGTLGEALDHLGKGGIDLVMLDPGLPDSNGLETVQAIVEAAPDVPVVVLTGQYDAAEATRAIRHGADDHISKNDLTGPMLRRVVSYARERHAARKAEAASRAKSALLANVSHEMRTPLTAILGYADLLVEPELSPRTSATYVGVIRRNAEHLLTVINDILDLSKIESGRMTCERVSCSPATIVSEVASLLRPRASGKGLTLDVSFRGPIPETVESDPVRLRQILLNLLGNAIKFTESGGVRLATWLDRDAKPPRLYFQVVDTGIGIDAGRLTDLFQPFVQGDASMSRRFGGTGLGLLISRRLAEMLGGEVVAHSEAGDGSTFTLHVDPGPLEGVRMLDAPEEAAPAQPEPPSDLGEPLGCRVLLAEDGPDNQRLIAYLLRRAGADVAVADNGRIACDAVRQAEADARPFDVVLMDIQMPVLDGYAATAELRRSGFRRPIVALTAHAMAGERERCLAAGCNDFVAKPVRFESLIATVHRHSQTGRSA